jgi:hypothetical protein
LGLPPRIAETDECGERACFWIADVMDMHSEMTRDTGSTATETGRLRYCILGASDRGAADIIDSGWSGCSIALGFWASRLILYVVEFMKGAREGG